MKFSHIAGATLLAGVLGVTTANADTLNCLSGCSFQSFAGAIWSTDPIQTSGTGAFEPFVRLQGTGNSDTEDGHNTDAPSQDFENDEKAGVWTHSVLMSAVGAGSLVGFEGSWLAFALDFGESGNSGSGVSLDALKVCTASEPDLVKADDCPTSPAAYDLDAGGANQVLLDYSLNGSGNGGSDLYVFIPAFSPYDTYMYLYSAFGATLPVHGTFSEWSYFDLREPGTPGTFSSVPEPASLLLLGSGLAAARARLRRRKA